MSLDFSDQDLLGRVRGGDTSAFGDLYAHHSGAAHRAARRMVRDPQLAEDLVSESFARVFKALRSENGPRGDLFPYLLVTMRNVASSWGRDRVRWKPVGDDDSAFLPRDARDLQAAADEAPVDRQNMTLTSSAFGTLPARWRTVLWYLEVEGESATEVGRRLALSDVAVRQLARRAREGLREAYLTAYLGGTPTLGAHIPTTDLVQMARGRISVRRRGQVEKHLDTCPHCTRLLFEAAEENSTFRALALPFYLAAGYAVVHAVRGAGHHASGVGAVRTVAATARRFGGAAQTAQAVGAAAGVVGVVGVATLVGPHLAGGSTRIDAGSATIGAGLVRAGVSGLPGSPTRPGGSGPSGGPGTGAAPGFGTASTVGPTAPTGAGQPGSGPTAATLAGGATSTTSTAGSTATAGSTSTATATSTRTRSAPTRSVTPTSSTTRTTSTTPTTSVTPTSSTTPTFSTTPTTSTTPTITVAPAGGLTVNLVSATNGAHNVLSLGYTVTNADPVLTLRPLLTITLAGGVELAKQYANCTPTDRLNAPVYVCRLDDRLGPGETGRVHTLRVVRADGLVVAIDQYPVVVASPQE